MYLPSHFEETRIDELQRIIRDHPLGALVVVGPNGLDANHLPFELDTGEGDAGVLRTHVARANPLAREAHDGDEALVIFRGPEAYVSPNWYPSKPETHRLVPTWNYQVVHVHGRMTIRDDVKHLRGLVARLTRTHESAAGEQTPWRMADSPAEYIDMMLAAIVGVDVVIERVVGKSKLSQNREARDRLGAAEVLGRRGHETIAEAMRTA